MKYLITISDAANEEKVFCASESEAIAIIEQKVRDGVLEDNIGVYLVEPVSFQVERVPVVKISENSVVETQVAETTVAEDEEPEVPDFRAKAIDSSADTERTESINPFLSEQVFSLDS